MPRFDVHTPTPYVPAPAAASPAVQSHAASAPSGGGESFLSELLDIVNPLQHLPVIGTIYRALTGDRVDAFAKVAGDALYGGVWGAAGAVADVAFEAATGKSVEDTVLALFDSSDRETKVAANLTAPTTGSIAPPAISLPSDAASPDMGKSVQMPSGELAALTSALSAKGVTGETAQRALYAYQRSVLLTGQYITSGVN
ncbi:MAG: hypothetical protein BGN85_07280 [Alphaproteobacteria bacterium 64-11]|nr:hypothetical protein [Alphaproteobacteria bacterium]OJU11192.1 MAG: hypothetical protein BGN85_07280 [Alphaproteobacteria bacterium 64-11]